MKKFNKKRGGVKNIMSLLFATTLATTACTDDVNELRPQTNKQLSVNVNVKPTSRAGMIAGNALPNGVKIGVSVTTSQGEPYDGIADYINVPFTAQQGDGIQEWNPGTPIMLSGSEGTLHAYYPYTPGVNYTAVPVDITAQEDWMVAEQPCTVNDANPSANITLKHVQTAVNVNVQRDQNYTGQGNVTALAITSEGLASSATLNTVTGAFSSFSGTNTPISIIASPFQLTAEAPAQENPYMFIPAAEETKDFTITATIDGSQYKHDVTMAEPFAEGKVYKLNVTVTNVGLKVESAVIVQDWSIFDEFEDATLQPDNGSDSEYDPYVEQGWMRLTYNAKEGQTVNVLNDDGSFSMSNVSKMAVLTNNPLSRASDELTEITPSSSYTFEKQGRNQLYIRFIDDVEIPKRAYYGCEELVEVLMSDKVKTIGEYAFAGCEGLTEVTLGENVQTIRKQAFRGCGSLEEITIGENVQTIGEQAFYYCTGLQKVTIEAQEIEGQAFSGCTGLTEVTIGEGVQTIGEQAFMNCSSLEEVTIGTGVQVIEEGAFMYCGGLQEVTIAEGVKTIGEYAFQDCSSLERVVIPNSVTEIGKGAFEACTGLKEVTIGTGVENIGEGAFEYCESLCKITALPMNALTIEEYTFYGVKEGGVLYIPDGATGYDTWMSTNPGELGYYNWTTQTIQ